MTTERAAAAAGAAPPACAEAILARARADCVAAGLSPLAFAELALQEALLAMMVHGLTQAECVARLRQFTEGTVGEWYVLAQRATERCDCAREHLGDPRKRAASATE